MNRKRWLDLAKWAWLVLVFAGVVYYLSGHSASVLAHLRQFSARALVLSFASLIAAKFLLTYLSLWSIEGQAWHPTFGEMFYFNAVTQLAKYLPGGVWHFVGRFGLYRAKGMTNAQSGKTMLAENLWLLLSAACFGVLASLIGGQEQLLAWIKGPVASLATRVLPLLTLFIWIGGLVFIERFAKLAPRYEPAHLVRLLLLQAAIWALIGAGFWVLLPTDWSAGVVGVSLGAFALSWVAGFLVPFAPSGLGVREAALAALLAVYAGAEAIAVYAAVSRIIWVVTELALGLLSGPLFGSGDLAQASRGDHPISVD